MLLVRSITLIRLASLPPGDAAITASSTAAANRSTAVGRYPAAGMPRRTVHLHREGFPARPAFDAAVSPRPARSGRGGHRPGGLPPLRPRGSGARGFGRPRANARPWKR